ncbi:MAG: hypothetical protein KF764_02965 [Labilithrix sp.]|nr:hypothetical protein [Labilithrix sp.]
MATDRESTLVLKIEDLVSEPSERVASALEATREETEKLYVAKANLQKQARDVKGTDEESKKLQSELKQKIREVSDAISQRQKAMAKEGVSFDQLSVRVRKLKADEDKLAKAHKEEAKARDDAAKKAKADSEKRARQQKKDAGEAKKLQLLHRTNVQGALNSFGGGGGLGRLVSQANGLGDLLAAGAEGGSLMAMGMAAGAAAAVALAYGIGKATYELSRWIVASNSELRNEKLQRQAWLAGAADADRLGDHIEELARRVPLARSEINQLSIGLLKSGIGGQTMVDTLNAIAQASAALGGDAASKLQGMVTRGRMTGNFYANPLEMVGTGLDTNDIAKALSEQMGIGVKEAHEALLSGRVKLADGARALRKAVEDNVGKINAEKLLDLDVMGTKAREALTGMTKDVNLKPLLEGFGSMARLLDTNTASGKILKGVVTKIGDTMASWAGTVLTDVSEGIKEWIAFFLNVDTKVLNIGNHIKDVVDKAAKLTGTVDEVNRFTGRVSEGSGKIGKAVVYGAAEGVFDGLLAAFTGGLGPLFKGGVQMAKQVDSGFRSEAEIKSPSKKMERHGRMLTEGLTGGMEKGAPEVEDTSRALFQLPPAGDIAEVANSSTTNNSSSSNQLVVNFNVTGGASGAAFVAEVRESGLIEQLRLAALSRGLAPRGI